MDCLTSDARPGAPIPTRFFPVSLALLAMGLLGILALTPTVLDALGAVPPEMAELPKPALVLISLLNPTLLMLVAIAVGTLLAHRVGLRSLVADKLRTGAPIWPGMRPHVAKGAVAGALFMGFVLLVDYVVLPFADLDLMAETVTVLDLVPPLVLGVLYGGIVEELLLRWGLMSLLVWLGWRIGQRGRGEPGRGLMWVAIVLSAVLFGVGHLPALATIAPLTPLLVARTVLLNALGGLLFGWLYWRRSLEVAMVSHAAAHVGLFLINLGILLLH